MNYSQTLTIQIQDTCKGVFLEWVCPNGSVAGWLFAGDTDEGLEEIESTSFRPHNARVDKVLAIRANETQTLRTGKLTDDQARAISHLFTSPQVYKIVNGVKSEVEVIAPGGEYLLGGNRRHDFVFQIITATRNSQVN